MLFSSVLLSFSFAMLEFLGDSVAIPLGVHSYISSDYMLSSDEVNRLLQLFFSYEVNSFLRSMKYYCVACIPSRSLHTMVVEEFIAAKVL